MSDLWQGIRKHEDRKPGTPEEVLDRALEHSTDEQGFINADGITLVTALHAAGYEIVQRNPVCHHSRSDEHTCALPFGHDGWHASSPRYDPERGRTVASATWSN